MNHYFSCFPLPPTNEHSFNSSRFLPLIFTRSICNYQTDSWWDLFSLDICFLFVFLDAIKSELLILTFQTDIVKIWAHIKLSPFYYKSEWLNKLRFTPLPTTAYLSHIPSLTPSHYLSSNRFSKCIRKKGCFIFLQEIGRRITKSNLRVLNRNWYSYLYQHKASFPGK